MSQQSVNLRKFVRMVRRQRKLVGTMLLAGFLVGLVISVLQPPRLTSTALVVLPQNAPNVATEVVIAGSEPVLSRALPNIQPPMSLEALRSGLSVNKVTGSVISISAQSTSGAQAQQAANAVAHAYVAYVRVPKLPLGNVAAQVLQPATPATGMGALTQGALDAGLGAVAGLLAGVVTAVIVGRRDRTLRDLDDIANSIAVPVLAAVPVGRPGDAAGWTRLLDEYQPGAVDAWRLRQALGELGISETNASEPETTSVTVLTTSSDQRALALGPQLAAYAASLAIPTLLVVGPQQDSNATSALYTACVAPKGTLKRSPHLRTAAADTIDAGLMSDARLVVVVVVVDGKRPKLPVKLQTDVAVLGVTAGAGTSEQLALVASAAVAAGGDVTGFLVADPDSADQTTGRIPRSPRTVRRVSSAGREQNVRARPRQASASGSQSDLTVNNGLVISP